MTEIEMKYHLDLLVKTAKEESVTMTLNLISQYLSLYHQRRDDESLIKMNYYMLILLIKQGLMDPDKCCKDVTFIIKQRELLEIVNQLKS
jgi:hypothetical protein